MSTNDFEIDESQRPIIVVTFPAMVSPEAYKELFRQYVSISNRGEKVGYVIDMRRFNPIAAPAAMRRLAAETFAAARPHLVKVTVCEARVVSSAITRGVLTAFDWLTGSKWPCRNSTSMSDADRWVREQMGSHLAAG